MGTLTDTGYFAMKSKPLQCLDVVGFGMPVVGSKMQRSLCKFLIQASDQRFEFVNKEDYSPEALITTTTTTTTTVSEFKHLKNKLSGNCMSVKDNDRLKTDTCKSGKDKQLWLWKDMKLQSALKGKCAEAQELKQGAK